MTAKFLVIGLLLVAACGRGAGGATDSAGLPVNPDIPLTESGTQPRQERAVIPMAPRVEIPDPETDETNPPPEILPPETLRPPRAPKDTTQTPLPRDTIRI